MMTERTYLFGYGNGPYGSASRRTRPQIEQHPQFAMVDPELMRRLFALADAVIESGSDYGFGGGSRTTEQQTALFLSRHIPVPSGGCCGYQGKRYSLKPGAAHAAPPGQSYHEPTTTAGKALAVDMIGEHKVGNLLAGRCGLVYFKFVNGEDWHYQPVEVAQKRKNYAGPEPLPAFGQTQPPPTTEDDDMTALPTPGRVYDSRQDNGQSRPLQAGEIRVIPVAVDPAVKAVYANLTVVDPADPGYLTAWGGGNVPPNVSNVNWSARGQVVANTALLPVVDKCIRVRSIAACHLVVDIQGVQT